MRAFISSFFGIARVGLYLAVFIFLCLTFLSIFVVPFTWLYSKIVGQSYSFTIYQSDKLYKLNILGQWTILILFSIIFTFTILGLIK
jgi:hypothetical protein